MIIEATAPTRVDLAGGTIDIWPLYLFHPGATTVNFAVSLHAACRIEPRADDRIILESRDRGVTFETSLAGVQDLVREERLELISKLVHFFKPETGFRLVADSMAPAGAGLGGSSVCLRGWISSIRWLGRIASTLGFSAKASIVDGVTSTRARGKAPEPSPCARSSSSEAPSARR